MSSRIRVKTSSGDQVGSVVLENGLGPVQWGVVAFAEDSGVCCAEVLEDMLTLTEVLIHGKLASATDQSDLTCSAFETTSLGPYASGGNSGSVYMHVAPCETHVEHCGLSPGQWKALQLLDLSVRLRIGGAGPISQAIITNLWSHPGGGSIEAIRRYLVTVLVVVSLQDEMWLVDGMFREFDVNEYPTIRMYISFVKHWPV